MSVSTGMRRRLRGRAARLSGIEASAGGGRRRQELLERGFVVLPGALPSAAVGDLRAHLVGRVDELNADGEIIRAARGDEVVRRSPVLRELGAIAADLLDRRVVRVFDHAICRRPDDDRTTRWHQDHGYFRWGRVRLAVHLWVPLQTVDEQLGPLRYLPAPHPAPLLPHRPLAGTSRVVLDVDESSAVAITAEPGDVVAHLPGTPHAAQPNRSDGDRWTWTVQYRPWWSLAPARLVTDAVRGRRRVVPEG